MRFLDNAATLTVLNAIPVSRKDLEEVKEVKGQATFAL